MQQVGSTAVARFVGEKKSSQIHFEQQARDWIRKHGGNNRTVWIVTMVRNRFLRDVSSLFENRKTFAVSLSDNYEALERTFRINFHSEESLTAHWFRDVWAPATGLDLAAHAHEFSPTRRSLFVASGRLRVVLLRFEDIDNWGATLHKYFPHFNQTQLQRLNAKRKTGLRAAQYNDFRARVAFTDDQIQKVSAGDSFQFYSTCERAEMKRAARSPQQYSICTGGRLCTAEQRVHDALANPNRPNFKKVVDELEQEEQFQRLRSRLPLLLNGIASAKDIVRKYSDTVASKGSPSFVGTMAAAGLAAAAVAAVLACAVAATMAACSFICEAVETRHLCRSNAGE